MQTSLYISVNERVFVRKKKNDMECLSGIIKLEVSLFFSNLDTRIENRQGAEECWLKEDKRMFLCDDDNKKINKTKNVFLFD